ncbi:D-alanyl-D-alanine carboxypeptidase family protein [Agrococcus casei]|uniref:D-alanyl-D-alanine carboxypeptidase n=1 Tax=Agrococcus casei LMG 22410 TaxID=1255656 RepID=A0A1R4FST9_9MICO|nr:serine hydrolase [Agrococcus casei]SJM58812.1 D-alanyl-D-alanine carboxypeptidase [Agrococcus casei LMG 22410]
MAESDRRGVHPAIAGTVVLVLFVLVLYAVASMLASPPSVAAQPKDDITGVSEEGEPLALPRGTDAGAVAIIGHDDAIESTGDDQPLPMASIAKIVTALVLLEEHPMEPGSDGATITMGETDLQYYWDMVAEQGSLTDVRAGAELSQRELMERMLVISSGNAALSLANWGFGSQEAFVEAAASWISEQGLESMTVVDPVGISADSVATAGDMARLARIAYDNETLRELLGVERIQVFGSWAANSNPLLGEDGVTGGKTGSLFASGSNLMLFAEREVAGTQVPVVSVVVGVTGTASVSTASLSLLDQAYSGFREQVVLPEGTVVGEYQADWSDRVITASTAEDLTAVTWKGIEVPAAVLLQEVEPGTLSASPGNLTVSSFGTTTSVEVKTDGVIPPPDFLYRLLHPQMAISWVAGLFG